jgi:hypothetical protein
MIHIIITIRGGPELELTLHEFRTDLQFAGAEQMAHVIRTFLPAWLKTVATGANAKYRSILSTDESAKPKTRRSR